MTSWMLVARRECDYRLCGVPAAFRLVTVACLRHDASNRHTECMCESARIIGSKARCGCRRRIVMTARTLTTSFCSLSTTSACRRDGSAANTSNNFSPTVWITALIRRLQIWKPFAFPHIYSSIVVGRFRSSSRSIVARGTRANPVIEDARVATIFRSESNSKVRIRLRMNLLNTVL